MICAVCWKRKLQGPFEYFNERFQEIYLGDFNNFFI